MARFHCYTGRSRGKGWNSCACELQKVLAFFGVSFGAGCRGGTGALFQPRYGGGNIASHSGLLVGHASLSMVVRPSASIKLVSGKRWLRVRKRRY